MGGSTDVIRDKDRSGIKTQIFGLDVGIGTGTEALMSSANPMPISGKVGPAASATGTVTSVVSSLTSPVANTPSTATSGGTLAAATYYYKLTTLTAAGESAASNEVSQVTTGAASTVTVTWGAITGATGYRIYRGTAAGVETVYYSVGAVTTFTDTGAANTAGTPPALSIMTLLASNANRLGAAIFNDATSTLYLALGLIASATVHTVQVTAASYYELPGQTLIYTGAVTGAWATALSGSARVTELT